MEILAPSRLAALCPPNPHNVHLAVTANHSITRPDTAGGSDLRCASRQERFGHPTSLLKERRPVPIPAMDDQSDERTQRCAPSAGTTPRARA